ncbi:MAG: hypothetical protein QN209_08340 [Armatimonadota bacterium]|nr:hypothetical protein [Armatimonadota bacterium]MDR7464690.1 hypothetical protein [Armatimonadota bacterium]MDR7470251.1 hypothetical protein [Armatimonadota bacterium]
MLSLRLPLTTLLACTVSLTLLAAGGRAEAPVRLLPQTGAEPAVAVVLQEVVVLRVRGPGAALRAAEVVRRLGALVAAGGPYTVAVRPRPGAADLLVNERHLVTADGELARLNRTTPEALAAQWAARLQQALARNTVRLFPPLLRLSPGERASVSVQAFLPGAVRLGPFDRRIASVRVEGGTVVVEARAVGSTVVPVAVGGGRVLLPVVVRPLAGTIPEEVTVRVSGDLTDAALIREAVRRRIDQVVRRGPGATLAVGPFPSLEGMAADADRVELAVPVVVRSPYALPVDGVARVVVLRERVQVADPALLLVSNRPEVVDADGILFSEAVDARHPIRLLYHHMNGTPARPRILSVMLWNRSTQPSEMLLISGLAGPSPDSLFVGHAAAARFLRNLAAGRGYVLEVPPNSAYAFTVQTMAPRQLVSGILQLQLLRGEELEVRVQVRLPWLLEGTVPLPVYQVAYPHPRGVFPLPTVTVHRRVELGGPVPLVDLGAAAGLQDVRTAEPLVGDYGVVYRLLLTVAGGPTEVQAELVAVAAGGPARGTFLVDGRPVEIAIYRPGEERVLGTLTVPAGQSVQVGVVTMPAAGSYYPVRLLLRPKE